jgi:hypothetical protein
MSKIKRKVDERQGNLFAYMSPKAPPSHGLGSQIRQALSAALRKSGKKDELICADIYSITGMEVSPSSLRKWTAPAGDFESPNTDHNGNKRWGIPAELIPAICWITGEYEILYLISEASNHKAMRGKEVVHAKIGQLKEKISREQHELKELERKLLEEE